MNEPTDAVVAPALERKGIGDLYAQHAAPLQRLAYLLTGDHHLAEDLTQQAFVKFYGRFFNLRSSSAAAAYLRKTLLNLARGSHRRKHIEREYIRRHANSVEQAVEMPSVENSDLVVKALHALPYRQRAAIVLRFYEDLTEAQAADIMDCSPTAMKSLTARAMSSLRALLEGADSD